MLTLRKDVRLGLMIGGILLAVVGVYLMLSMVGSNPQTAEAGGIDIAKGPPAVETKPVATNKKPETTKQVEPKDPVASSSNEDLWSIAFSQGEVKSTATRTENPLNKTTDPKVKQEAIDSINRAVENKNDPNDAVAPKSNPNDSTSNTNETKTNESKPAGESKTYVIQPGDTFSSIALEHYGDSRFYKLILDANPKIDPNRMKVGMTITIPPMSNSTQVDRDDTTDVAADTLDPSRQYRVQVGDSLNSIASRLYGDSQMWGKIYELNKAQIGDNPARLKLGMVLVLPSAPTR